LNIYTKTGDTGQTMLQDGVLIPKHHPVIKALAALDELNSVLGITISQLPPADSPELIQIQKNIMSVMSFLSAASEKTLHNGINTNFDDLFINETKHLESSIDKLSAMIPTIKSFVTYGTCPQSANLDLARAVARRSETYLSQAAKISDYARGAFPYINRLSDFLYMKARYADFEYSVVQTVQKEFVQQSSTVEQKNLSSVIPANNQNGTDITLSQAKTILEKIECKAKAMNLSIVAACCNTAGNPIAVHVMDGALLVSYEAAAAKAYTAAALKMPTMDLSKLVQPGQSFYGLEALGSGKILPIGGGVPLFDQSGRIIGAIGVSGGTAEQDHYLADFISEKEQPNAN